MRTEDKNYDRSSDGIAILNNNTEAYALFKQQRKQQNDHQSIQQQVDSLKSDVSDIKAMLTLLIQRENNGTINN